jgi:aminoglycoside 2'-N-acetyltransferase I
VVASETGHPVPVPTIRTFPTAKAPDGLLSQVRSLLLLAFPGSFTVEDWAHTLGGHHVVITDGGEIVSHAAVVARELDVGDRRYRVGYLEGVATLPARQRQGFGSLAVDEVSKVLRKSFDMGALSSSQQGFYAQLGWERWQGPTFVRSAAATVRSEEEDDGIMVLRFGLSAGVDLTDPLSCEARAGDDW